MSTLTALYKLKFYHYASAFDVLKIGPYFSEVAKGSQAIHAMDWQLITCRVDDTAKGGLTIFVETVTVIPCAPKHLKCQYYRYLKTFGSQIGAEDSFSDRSCLKIFGSKH